MTVSISIDARIADARFSERGIPTSVRNNLRRILPDIAKRLGANVDARLDSQLKSRRRLQTKMELVENPTAIYSRVSVVATAEPKMLPQWLETGTRAHPIVATNASALFFFWEKMGMNVAFKRVWHPGFAGIGYMQNAFQEMEEEIRDKTEQAVRQGMAG